MPAKPRTPRKSTAAKTEKSTSAPVGDDAALLAREQDAAERTRVAATGIYVTPIDGEGKATGPAQHLGDASVTLDLEPLDAAEFPQVASLPSGNIELEFTASDPATVALARELTRIPIPTAVINQWFPAMVRLPGAETVWTLCKVFLTPQGLYVYRTRPVEPEAFTTGAHPTWYSPVDFEKTRKPVSGYAARNAGIPIVTAAGTVTVQPTSGCGCGSGIKGWRPDWSRNVISWADGVQLATGSTAGR